LDDLFRRLAATHRTRSGWRRRNHAWDRRDAIAWPEGDRRLAPELRAVGWAGASAGDSGGGALAARVCLRRLDPHPNMLPDIQGLYATTDLTASQPSMREDACGG
jgi:hypothetical protein